MIGRLRGQAVGFTADGLVLDVGGVGYTLSATPSAIQGASVSGNGAGEVVIETHLHVREDTLQLFGFASTSERELFVLLLTVSGIGPKVALAIVSAYEPAELRRAMAQEDAALFQSIPGIGRKLAQRIVLELRERIETIADTPPGMPASDGQTARDALVLLGFSPVEAEQKLAGIDEGLPVEDRVRMALRAG
ncbi:MAG: Holliday junction branch migration protein RuvA [Gaiellaceae bacterium]